MDSQVIVSYFQTAFLENKSAQIIGFIAYFVTIYAFAFCKETKFLRVISLASFIWFCHFSVLGGAMVAAAMNFIDVFKNYYAIKHEKNFKILLFFASVYAACGYFFYIDLYSLIPLTSSIIGLYLAFYVRGIFLNLGFLVILIFWFIYNVQNNSIAGIASDITLFFAGVYGIFTMFILKKGKNTES